MGGVVAEQERTIEKTYVENSYLKAALDHQDGRCFVIGRTGSGKSALLRMVAQRQHPSQVVELNATDFTFRRVEISEVIAHLHRIGGNLSYVYKTIWKYLIVVTLLKRRYPDLKERVSGLKQLFYSVSDPKKKIAYDFLIKNEEIYGERSFGDRLVAMLERLEGEIGAGMKVSGVKISPVGVDIGEISLDGRAQVTPQAGGALTANDSASRGLGREVTSAVERAWDVPSLHQVIELLDTELLRGRKYWILIDDLDRAFADSPLSSEFIRTLFEVIMEMSHIAEVRFLVALRTNIFTRLKFYQREKVVPFCLTLRWNSDELRAIIEERVRWAFHAPGMRVFGKDALFAATVRDGARDSVETFEFIRSRTLDRPRDAVQFAQCALEASLGHRSVTADAISQAERTYSAGRLEALEDEWGVEYPALSQVMAAFRRSHRSMSPEQFLGRVADALVNALDEKDKGGDGIAAYALRWNLTIEGLSTTCDAAIGLALILWIVGAVGIRRPGGGTWNYNLASDPMPSFRPDDIRGCSFRVHPMLHKALDIGRDDGRSGY